MPQELIRDEEIRLHGWNVFRSSSRDHMVPMTSGGRVIQRVKIGSALPAGGVTEGVAISLEEREAVARSREDNVRSGIAAGSERPLGVSRFLSWNATIVDPSLPSLEVTDQQILIARAPFDGFITEFGGVMDNFTFDYVYAIRTSSGQTMFSGTNGNGVAVLGLSLVPDFTDIASATATVQYTTLRNLKMPVFAGEEIYLIARVAAGTGSPNYVGSGILGFEGYVLARPGSAAAESQFLALTQASINAARDASNNAGRLAVERERTRRVEIEADARLKAAQLAAEVKRQAGIPMQNPFNQVLLSRQGQDAIARRQPVKAPSPPFESAGAQAPSGKGQTFVSAWMPSSNGIGYTIPDPPQGGRVNVFGDTYTVWSASGQMVEQGKVNVVRSDADIPSGSRISRNLGVRPSQGMREDQQAILTTRSAESAFG